MVQPLQMQPSTELDGTWSPFQPIIVAGLAPDSPDSRTDANLPISPYAGVGSLQVIAADGQSFLSSATPISPRHILTAAHSFDAEAESQTDPNLSATFNLNFNRDLSHQIPVVDYAIFPDYLGFPETLGADLAIATLAQDLPPEIPIYKLHRGPLAAGTEITLVGYGVSGNGVDGYISGTASPAVKRVGYNQVEDLTVLPPQIAPYLTPETLNQLFLFDFDGPDASTNLFALSGSGFTLGNELEAGVGPGDSGGPSFIRSGDRLLLAGVNTFTFGVPSLDGVSQGINAGQFGSGGGGVLLSEPAKLSWIDSILGVGSISGIHWLDLDGDGDRSLSEPGLAGWTVYLDRNLNRQFDADEPHTLTDEDGGYTLVEVPAGTYTLAAAPPTSSWPSAFAEARMLRTTEVAVIAGETLTAVNLGHQPWQSIATSLRETNFKWGDRHPMLDAQHWSQGRDRLLGMSLQAADVGLNDDVLSGQQRWNLSDPIAADTLDARLLHWGRTAQILLQDWPQHTLENSLHNAIADSMLGSAYLDQIQTLSNLDLSSLIAHGQQAPMGMLSDMAAHLHCSQIHA